MSNLYQDAILDAKALRASAMANAKAALEEAFEPKIQEMIAKHLSEEDEKEADMEEEYGAKEEGEDVEGAKMEGQDADIKEEELDEILNQLEEMSSKEDEKTLKEAEEGDDEAKEGDEEEEKEEGEEEEQEEEEEGGGDEAVETEDEVGDETKIVDITLGDLKQVIQSLMAGQEEMPAGEEPAADSEGDEEVEDEEASGDEDTSGDEEASKEEEVSLDEILDELEAEGRTGLPTDTGIADVGEYDANDVQSTDVHGDETFSRGQAIRERKKMKEEGKHAAKKEEGKMAKELKEARATINTLRKDLQEVNLLNAKYLYMNKLFKAKPLSESQKLKVINTLDRATTVKEVKRAFEIMNESLSARKSQLKESVGFASKPAGVAPKANIVESEQFINRWQKLAGIK